MKVGERKIITEESGEEENEGRNLRRKGGRVRRGKYKTGKKGKKGN